MSPEIIEQLHRMEHKLDKILEALRIGELHVEDINASRVCPICEREISWGQNKQGEAVRRCGCDLNVKSLDFNSFAPPSPIQKG